MLEAYITCSQCGTSNAEQIVIPLWKIFGVKCRNCGYRMTPQEVRKWSEEQLARTDHKPS